MSESTQPLPHIAEEYRQSSHHWQTKWAEFERQLVKVKSERDELISVIRPIVITHRARNNHPLDSPCGCDACKLWRKLQVQ